MKRKLFSLFIGLFLISALLIGLSSCGGGSNPPDQGCQGEHNYKYYISAEEFDVQDADADVVKAIKDALAAPNLECSEDKGADTNYISLKHVKYCIECGDYKIENHDFETVGTEDGKHNIQCKGCMTLVYGAHCYEENAFTCYYCGVALMDNLFHYDEASEVLTFAPGAENFTAETLVLPKTFNGNNISRFGKVSGINSTYPNVKNLEIPAEYYDIREDAFKGWTSLEQVTIGVGTGPSIIVNKNAFSGCTGLKKLTVSSAATLEAGAFANCSALVEISGASLKEVKDGAFYGCSKVEKITVDKATKISNLFIDATLGNAEYPKNITLTVSSAIDNAEIQGKILLGQKDFFETLIFSEKIKSVEGFEDSVNLKKVVLASVDVIEDNTFKGCAKLAEIDLSGVTEIGSSAFSGCASITAVSFSEQLSEIGNEAFMGCSSISSVVLPEIESSKFGAKAFKNCVALVSATLKSEYIPYALFEGCEKLETLNAANVVEIEDSAFKNCGKLANLSISDEIEDIGAYAFENCVLITEFSFPNSILSLGDDIFKGCVLEEVYYNVSYIENFHLGNVKKLTVGKDVEKIPANFMDTSYGDSETVYLEELIFEEDSKCVEIGEYAFSGNVNIESVDLSGVEVFGYGCFSGCTGISEIDLSSAVVLEPCAFENCTNIKNASIPNTVTTLNDRVFKGVVLDHLIYNVSKVFDYPIFVAHAKKVTIGKDVVSIPENFVSNSDGSSPKACYVDEIIVEASDTKLEIGKYAFSTGSFSEFDFTRVESVGERAFSGCQNLLAANLVNAESVGDYAFDGCASLNSAALYDKVTSLGENIFRDCDSMETFYYDVPMAQKYSCFVGVAETITIGKHVEIIPGWFATPNPYTPSNLKEIIFEDDSVCTEIRNSAFRCASESFTTVTLPESLEIIDEYVFAYNYELVSVELENRDVVVDYMAFYDCTKFEYEEVGGGKYVGNTLISITGSDPVVRRGTYHIAELAIQGTVNTLTIPSSLKSFADNGIKLDKCGEIIIDGDELIEISYELKDKTGFAGINFKGFYCDGTAIIGIKNKNINRAIIPAGITEIKSEALSGISLLKYIYIPASVSSIGEKAFFGCDAKVTVYFESNRLPANAHSDWNKISNTKSIEQSSMVGNIKADKNGYVWQKNNQGIVVYGLIGTLAEISIPSSINGETVYAVETYEGSLGFADRQDVYYINIPASVKSIGVGVFRGCTNVQDITLNEGLETIGASAFEGCNSTLLSSISIPSTVVTIGPSAFKNCTSEYGQFLQKSGKDYHWVVCTPEGTVIKDFGLNGITSAVDFRTAIVVTYSGSEHIWINTVNMQNK